MYAILHKYGSYVVLPYSCHIDTMGQAYGLDICVSYSMNAVWYRYGSHMVIPYGFHMDTIRPAYGLAIWNTYGVSGANQIYAHMLAI